jgi:hypothetical protein
MRPDDCTTSEIQPAEVPSGLQPAETAQAEQPPYAAFIQQLGLREAKDGEQSVWIAAEGESRMLQRADDAVEAMREMWIRDGSTPREILPALEFVAGKTDRNRAVPPYVYQYMCRDAVRRAVLQRFNEAIGTSCTTPAELSNKISDSICEANETFNTIRLCDPAAGTGDFLIALLNEMIALKSQLGILADPDGNPLFQYKITVNGQELIVFDKKRFEIHSLDGSGAESRRIRETLRQEKQTLVENCLFGVDRDPVAVSICRLRLWLTQLQHAFPDDKQPFLSPATASNIRCGDPFISRFSVREDLGKVFKLIGYSAGEYKNLVNEYKKARTAEEKTRLKQLILLIKKELETKITWDDRHTEDLLKWKKTEAMLNAPTLFEPDENEKNAIRLKLLEARSMMDRYRQKAESLRNNPVFEHAIEWRYEFPELWNDSGDFNGFDILISHPQHARSQADEPADVYKQLNYKLYKHAADISTLFYELGNKLLKPEGCMSCFTANNWMKSTSAHKISHYLMNETNPLWMINFDRNGTGEHAPAEQSILILQKARNQYRMMSCLVKDDFDGEKTTLEDYVAQKARPAPLGVDGKQTVAEAITFTILSDTEKSIREKIERAGTSLAAWDIRMHPGIKTGCDEAFIIDGKIKDEFIRADYKNTDVIKPLLMGEDVRRYVPEQSGRWLIYIPWHFPLLYDATIKTASERAESRFRQQYPVLYEHLTAYSEQLRSRNTAEVGITFEWYALQRFGMNNEWDDFTQQKIVWKQESPASAFCLDYSGCAILDTTCFITGQHLKYLLGVLNSKLGHYMLRDSPRLADGHMQITVSTLETLKIPIPGIKIESEMISFVNKRTSDIHLAETEWFDRRIDRHVYEIYGLDEKETAFIETNITSYV